MSRDLILNRIKRNVRAPQGRVEAVEARLNGAITATRRQDWVNLGEASLTDVFIEKAEYASATVERIANLQDLPKAVSDFLTKNQLPQKIKCGMAPLLEQAGLFEYQGLSAAKGIAINEDLAGLSVATLGLAESGTLLLTSGQDNPSTINFLPPNHIVVLRASDIVATYEQGWAKIRTLFPTQLPRSLNYITGPSRSADIEQTLLMGAHGPKQLHIVIIDNPL